MERNPKHTEDEFNSDSDNIRRDLGYPTTQEELESQIASALKVKALLEASIDDTPIVPTLELGDFSPKIEKWQKDMGAFTRAYVKVSLDELSLTRHQDIYQNVGSTIAAVWDKLTEEALIELNNLINGKE